MKCTEDVLWTKEKSFQAEKKEEIYNGQKAQFETGPQTIIRFLDSIMFIDYSSKLNHGKYDEKKITIFICITFCKN